MICNADRWLYTTLTGNGVIQAALGNRVYLDAAPANTEYPFCVMQQVTSYPVGNAADERIMDDELWDVTVWGEGPSYLALEPVADKIREVLHRASGTGVIAAVYEGARRVTETDGGRAFKAVQMEFRLFVQ